MAYLNLDPNYFENLKSKRLRMRLGEGADTIPLKLWCHAAKHHPQDGIFKNYTHSDLAILVGYSKDSLDMVEALLEFGLLERTTEGWYKIHEWEDHQGHIISFSERSKKANKVRWDKYRDNKSSNKESLKVNKDSAKESPIPNHTIPNHTLPTKPKHTFKPPTLEEVTAYKQEINSPVDPNDFLDFYATKGWKVGRESMKDWKAAFRRAKNWDKYQKAPNYEPKKRMLN